MRFVYLRKIGTRLGFGFAMVVGLAVLLGIIALLEINSLTNISRDLYDHPLVVSNAIRDIRGNILAMQRSMRDAILAQTDTGQQEAVSQVEQEEEKVFQAFDVLYIRFLDNKADVEAARRAFEDWRVIRNEEIDLIQSGSKSQAVQIAQGKEAQQVSGINEHLQVISDFASQKATALFNRAQKSKQRHLWILSGLVLLTSIAGAAAGHFIIRSITGPLRYVMEQIGRVAGGNLDHKINLDSNDEIGQLARTFDDMTDQLKKITASRNDLDAAHQQISAANQQSQAHEQQMNATIQQLRDSEQYRESIISTVPGVIYQMQMDGHGVFSISYISPQAEDILGHPMNILIHSDCFLDIIHSQDVNGFLFSIQESARTLKPCKLVFRIYDKNGRLIWLKNMSTPQRLADHSTIWDGIIIDITDRKQDEARLRENEECYRIVADNTYDWEFWIDSEGRYVYISPSCQRITGYSVEEFKTDPSLLKTIIHPDDRPMYQHHIIQATTEKTAENIEFRVIHKDGQARWIEHFCRPVFDKEGRWLGVRGSNRDITARKQAEEALRQSEERFQFLFEEAPLGYQSLDEEGHFIRVNRAWLDTLGYSRQEVIGKWFGDFLAPEYVEAFRQRFPVFKAAGKIHSEFQMLHKNGQRRCIAFEGRVGYEPSGSFRQTHCILSDITERKKTEEALRREQELVGRIMETSPVGIAALNRHGEIMFANAHAEKILGLSRDQAAGRLYNAPNWHITDYDGNPFPDEELPFLRAKATGKAFYDIHFAICRPDGQRVLLSANTAPVFTESGEFDGAVTTFQDVTEHIRMEESLRNTLAFNQEVICGAGEGITVYDSQLCYLEWNSFMENLTGVKKESVLGKSTMDMFPHLRHMGVDQFLSRALAGETVQSEDMPFQTPQTDKKGWVVGTYTPHRDAHGTIIGVIGTIKDITQRKKMEDALQMSEMRYRTLFEGLSERIFLKDRNSVYVSCNQNYARDFNITADEMVGKTDNDLYASQLAEKYTASDRRIINSGKAENDLENNIHNGRETSILTVKLPMKDKDGNVTGLLGISLDLTEQKQNQKTLMDCQQQIQNLTSEISLAEEHERQRLAIELHDHITQSLILFKINMGMLLDGKLPAESSESLDNIYRDVDRIIEAIRSLTFDLASLTLYELGFEAAVAELLDKEVQQKYGIETEFENDAQSGLTDEDVHAVLYRAVRELLVNLVKHANAHHVKVTIHNQENKVYITIIDDGIGFIYPIEESPSTITGGFGLSSIRRSLNYIGGSLEIDSKPGHGTRVTLTAPIKCEYLIKQREL